MKNSCTVTAVIAFLAFFPLPSKCQLGTIVHGIPEIVHGYHVSCAVFPNLPSCHHRVFPYAYSDRVTKKDSSDGDSLVVFFITFWVGSQHRQVKALLSINSKITQIDNYSPTGSSTFRCCKRTNELSCSAPRNSSSATCNGDYSDQFTLNSTNLKNVKFKSAEPVDSSSGNATGYISFSRSNYSLISNLPLKIFSYYFSFSNSYFSLGYVPEATGKLESTKVVDNPQFPEHYTVTLKQIQIGKTLIDSMKPVIIDTVIPVITLEVNMYAKVKTELSKIGESFAVGDLEVCYNSSPDWPNLTLVFPSDSSADGMAQMVLSRNSYVVADKLGRECAAIMKTIEDVSVIGSLAQLNRTMVFDLSGPTVSFSKYTENGETKPTGLLVRQNRAEPLVAESRASGLGAP